MVMGGSYVRWRRMRRLALTAQNETILAEWQAELGVAGDLECEKTVAAFINESGTGRAPDGQAAQDKRSRGEPEVLVRCVAPISDQLDTLGLAQSPPRNVELAKPSCTIEPARSSPAGCRCLFTWEVAPELTIHLDVPEAGSKR